MISPEMLKVAGPPDVGKSSAFPLKRFGDLIFNADDRAAELNGGSYRHISLDVRQAVNKEFESFVTSSIESKQSLELETTLRSKVTFEQTKLAQAVGFKVLMIYVGLDNFTIHLEACLKHNLLGHTQPRGDRRLLRMRGIPPTHRHNLAVLANAKRRRPGRMQERQRK